MIPATALALGRRLIEAEESAPPQPEIKAD
jgi:hypothetical protein